MTNDWIKEPGKPIPEETIEAAKGMYYSYVQSKQEQNFQPPVVREFSLEDSNPDTGAMEVHIDVSCKGREFYLRSVKHDDAPDVFKYLTSQELVCKKYANKKTSTFEATEARVKVLANRFDPSTEEAKGFFMHGGFVVTEEEEGKFLGLVNTGGSEEKGFTEIGVRFRPDAWSHQPEELEAGFNVESDERLKRTYEGAGTAAVCALWEYTCKTAERGFPIKGEPLKGMRAVCRIDNPGGWKALASAGMILADVPVDAVESYGPELRFQTRRALRP